MNESFCVSTKHKTLAFSAAHFICHDEWREFIHGHNYRVGLSLEGIDLSFLHIIMLLASKIDSKTGYIVDFKDIEAPLKEIVENFKGKLIVPTLSKSLSHSDDGTSITLIHGKSKFMLPIEDCYLVDVEYSSVEELSKWIALKFVEKAGKENLINQHIKSIRLDMYETEDRMASYFCKLE